MMPSMENGNGEFTNYCEIWGESFVLQFVYDKLLLDVNSVLSQVWTIPINIKYFSVLFN